MAFIFLKFVFLKFFPLTVSQNEEKNLGREVFWTRVAEICMTTPPMTRKDALKRMKL